LSRRLFPEYKKHDLSTIITRFDFVCEARHRAMADAEVLVDFLKVCEKKFGQEVVHDAYKIVMKRNALPVALSHEHIDALPETAGVYIFYGDEGDTLYIGKSINIRNRVLSHFSDDHRSGKEMRMSQEIADIEAIPTSGELGALLLESHLIKERQPLYNRMSRYSRELVAAIESQNEAGYSSVSLERIADAQKLETEKVLGIFRSLKQAKTALNDLAKEHHLCPALLGIESNKRSCFFSQLGICKGACSGKEKADVYNARFTKGFARKRVKVWPFAGPVLITEKKDEYQGTVFVVDDWRLVESYVYDETGKQKFLPPTYVFDHDAYKILAGYLKKNKNIKPVTKSEFSRLGDYEGVTQSIDF
jgi:DNA polymerase-3 subunit epsilon